MATNSSASRCAHGLEGIIAKHLDNPIALVEATGGRRSPASGVTAFVVVGFEPSTVPGHLGGLLLAARKDQDLIYAGAVGRDGQVISRASCGNCSKEWRRKLRQSS